MAFGSLKVLSSRFVISLLIVLYVKNLVAIADKKPSDSKVVYRDDVQTGNEDILQFQSLSAALSEENDELTVMSSLASSVPINFDPPNLNFSQQAIGISSMKEIRINNPTHSLTLQLISISGNQPDFHSSFFASKVLRPGESTTFEIVFLPRVFGVIEDILLIQSSFGTYKYEVCGVGIQNEFRLRPLRGARIPINATYSPSITMYNPFYSSLQIIELYSSGGSLHLELPHGFLEGNKTVWEIRPYETKQIAKASFIGETISNHTAFIRIKTNHGSNPSILLPVEVEVSNGAGLFLSRELLDFGMIKSGGQVRLPIFMLNAGPHQVQIKSIIPHPDNPCIQVEYTNMTLKPSNKYIKVAVLVFSVGLYPLVNEIIDSGAIKVWAEDKSSFHQLTVPYEAHVLQGTLDYNSNDTLFRAHDAPFLPTLRGISLLNRFSSPIVIYSVKLSSKALDLFSVENFNPPIILQPDGEWHEPFRLRFRPHSSDCLLNTTLRLATNTSFFSIPLVCYDGSLECNFGGKDINALEFGLMSERDSHSKVFSIRNPNPVQVSVTSLQVKENSNLPFVAVHLLSLPRQPKKDDIFADGLRKGRRPPYYLDPGHQMVLSVNVTRPKRPGKYTGDILIYSSFGKVVTVPVNYQAIIGGIEVKPSHIKFSPTLPYSTSKAKLYVKSTYTKPIKLLSMKLLSMNGNRSVPISVPSNLPVIDPSTTTVIGDIVFDPLLLAGVNKTYQLPDLVKGDEMQLKNDLLSFDSLWKTWGSMTDSDRFDFQVIIDTEVDKNITVTGNGYLEWPSVVTKSLLSFPTTLIGNRTQLSFEIKNPSDRPLQINFMFLSDVLLPTNVTQTLSKRYGPDFMDITNLTGGAYSIKDDSNCRFKERPIFLLLAHENCSLEIEFHPLSDSPSSDMLLIRNNLTVFDTVRIEGLGSRGFITVNGAHPGGTVPLHFEYTQQMMEFCANPTTDCDLVGIPAAKNSLSMTFNIRNSGPLPVLVTATLGNCGRCKEHGFTVSNCGKPFAVYPNKTRKIDITFIPDYSLSKITSTLHLFTPNHSNMVYPIVATVPHSMLLSCYSALPRSEMESLSSYLAVPLWLLALLIMVFATVFQVNLHTRWLDQTILPITVSLGKDISVQSTGGFFFDLSNIARKISSNITEKVVELGKSAQISKPFEMDMTSCDDTVQEEFVDANSESELFSNNKSMELINELHPYDGRYIDVKNTTVSPTADVEPTLTCLHQSQTLSVTPEKKSRLKKTCMKVEKSALLSGSEPYLSSDFNLQDCYSHPSLRLHLSSNDDSRFFNEKETHTQNQDDPVSEDYTNSFTADMNNINVQNTHSSPLSFAKEPGTGQTVLVKEDMDENGNYPITEKPVPLLCTSSVVSFSVSIGKARSKAKKQKAHHKREEKLKRKRKEKEDLCRRSNEAQESFDKSSVTSSTNSADTNSADNLEDIQPSHFEQTLCDNQEKHKVVDSESSAYENAMTANKNSLGMPQHEKENQLKQTSCTYCIEDVKSAAIKNSDLYNDEDDAHLLEMETSCSTIEFKTASSASPSPDDLEKNLSLDTTNSTKKVKDCSANTTMGSNEVDSCPASPKRKLESPLPARPNNSTGLPLISLRPSKLDLDVPNVEGDSIRDKAKIRLDPHELAASLLKKMPRPQKHKQISATIQHKETVEEENFKRTHLGHRRKNSSEKQVSGDGYGARDRRNNISSSTPLSSDAIPFYPHFPGIHSPMDVPHALPTPTQFPSNQSVVPTLYGQAHHPSYDYPPTVRPVYSHEEQIMQFERKRRKKSDHHYPKNFSPTYTNEHYQSRHPFLPSVEGYSDLPEEWMGSSDRGHSMPIYSEEDPLAISYPTMRQRSRIYGRSGVSPPYLDMPQPVPISSQSTGSELDGNQLTPEEKMYLRELRRHQQLKKLMRETQQGESFEGLSLQHSTDLYSLASLRERDHEQGRPLRQNPYFISSSPTTDTKSADITVTSSFPNETKSNMEDFISPYEWQQSSAGIINRAPGHPVSFSEPVMTSSSSDQQHHSHFNETEDQNRQKDLNSSQSNRSEDNSAWQSLWTMQTPLFSALEEQREATKANDHSSYDLFEGNRQSIWSLNKDDHTFTWITNPSDSQKN